MKLSLAEIVKTAREIKKREEKVDWLKKNDNPALRTILKYMYDKENVEFLIPSSPPPWKKNGLTDIEGLLYNEARRLKIFVKGGGYDHLNQLKRENLFIGLVEDVDDADSELLLQMIQQKPLKGLPKSVVEEAFPNIFKEKVA